MSALSRPDDEDDDDDDDDDEWRGGGRGIDSFVLRRYPIYVQWLKNFLSDCSPV